MSAAYAGDLEKQTRLDDVPPAGASIGNRTFDMAQLTRAQKVIRSIGIARGNLAFLGQSEAGRIRGILARFATQYRINEREMTRARSLGEASIEDCGVAVVANLNALVNDASFIRGFTPLDARRVNPHLKVLATECRSFSSAHAVRADIDGACLRFLTGNIGSGEFAGSALRQGDAACEDAVVPVPVTMSGS
jgi:hypothetical protein